VSSKRISGCRLLKRVSDLIQRLAVTGLGIVCSEGIESIADARKRGGSNVSVGFHIVGILNDRIPYKRRHGVLFMPEKLCWVLLRGDPAEFLGHMCFKSFQLLRVFETIVGAHSSCGTRSESVGEDPYSWWEGERGKGLLH
jgi:hypothetical protein